MQVKTWILQVFENPAEEANRGKPSVWRWGIATSELCRKRLGHCGPFCMELVFLLFEFFFFLFVVSEVTVYKRCQFLDQGLVSFLPERHHSSGSFALVSKVTV